MSRRLIIVTILTCLWAVWGIGPGLAKEKEPTLRELKQAVQQKPNDPEAYYKLGLKYESSGHLKEAKTAYQKAISLKPDYAPAYSRLGGMQGGSGDYEGSIKTLQKSLKLKKDDPEARARLAQVYNDYGVALGKQKNWQDAAQVLQKAIQVDPKAKTAEAARNNLGILYYSQGRLDEAMAQFKEVLRQNPDNPQATYNLGVSYIQAGDPHAAWFQYLKLRALDPEAGGELSSMVYNPQKKADYAPQPDMDRDSMKLQNRYQELLNPPGYSTARGYEATEPPASTGPPKSSWNPGGNPKSSWSPGQTPKSSW